MEVECSIRSMLVIEPVPSQLPIQPLSKAWEDPPQLHYAVEDKEADECDAEDDLEDDPHAANTTQLNRSGESGGLVGLSGTLCIWRDLRARVGRALCRRIVPMSNAASAGAVSVDGGGGESEVLSAAGLPAEVDAKRAWAQALVERARSEGVALTGEDGLLTSMVREVWSGACFVACRGL